MSKLLQLRGGTTSEHSSFTGAVREVTVDITKDTLVVHDGSTAAGFALARESALTTTTALANAALAKSGGALTGALTTNSTFDGRDVATDGTKLDGIEASATADQTASQILTAVKTVDGSGSGLDADTLDGQHASAFLTSTGDGSNLTGISSVLPITVVTTTTITAAAGNHYILTNSSATTLTLPATPSAGNTVMVTAQNGLATNIIARNSQLLQVNDAGAGLAENMTYDLPKVTLTLKFSNNIWRLI